MLTDDERSAFLAAAEEAGLLVHQDDVEAFLEDARRLAERESVPAKRDPFSMRVTFTIPCSTPHERAARVHP